MKLYRGTQRKEPKGVRKSPSWTPSLPVAVIYSAVPGDPFSHSHPDAYFLSTSTVHIAELPKNTHVIRLCGNGISCSFYEVLTQLKYGEPDGITYDEARKILNYMHNRIMGKAAGGEFQYKIVDEDGDEVEESFSFRSSRISEFRDEMEYEEPLEIAERLLADTFIYADAPSFKTAAKRLGYDVVRHADVFVGGISAAESLLGCDVHELDGVADDLDLEDEDVPVHETYRPLHEDAIIVKESVPSEELLSKVSCRAENPRRLKRVLSR